MTEQFDTFNDLYRAVLVSYIHIVYSFDSRFSCKTSPHPCCLNVVAEVAILVGSRWWNIQNIGLSLRRYPPSSDRPISFSHVMEKMIASRYFKWLYIYTHIHNYMYIYIIYNYIYIHVYIPLNGQSFSQPRLWQDAQRPQQRHWRGRHRRAEGPGRVGRPWQPLGDTARRRWKIERKYLPSGYLT